jgi:hypothetical protein
MILKIKGGRNPETENPGTKKSHRYTIMTLITRENKPRVRRVTGNDIKLKIGLINVFNKLITRATIMAVTNESTPMPFKYRGTIRTMIPVITNLIM